MLCAKFRLLPSVNWLLYLIHRQIDTHLSDIQRIERLLLLVMIDFVWVYNVGDYVHRNLKEIKIKKHGKKANSIFRYGLDIVS